MKRWMARAATLLAGVFLAAGCTEESPSPESLVMLRDYYRTAVVRLADNRPAWRVYSIAPDGSNIVVRLLMSQREANELMSNKTGPPTYVQEKLIARSGACPSKENKIWQLLGENQDILIEAGGKGVNGNWIADFIFGARCRRWGM